MDSILSKQEADLWIQYSILGLIFVQAILLFLGLIPAAAPNNSFLFILFLLLSFDYSVERPIIRINQHRISFVGIIAVLLIVYDFGFALGSLWG